MSWRFLVPPMVVAALLLAPDTAAGAYQANDEHSAPEDPTVQGNYVLTSTYRGDPQTTRGWRIEWQVPLVTNTDAPAVPGQWYFNLEAGIYLSDGTWYTYYFGDDNGRDGNHPTCDTHWPSGGFCDGELGGLQPGDTVTFTYRWCTEEHVPDINGARVCVWVDLHDGTGEQFLAEDERTTVEMYAHDVETFTIHGLSEPIIDCNQPVIMRKQAIMTDEGEWQELTGKSWDFEDTTDRYEYIDIDLSNGTWSACNEIDRYWVDTFADAEGYNDQNMTDAQGRLFAGTHYVYCKVWGAEVREGDAFNHWWLRTDLDETYPGEDGTDRYVSAYYLSRWGNDQAKDNDGNEIPDC